MIAYASDNCTITLCTQEIDSLSPSNHHQEVREEFAKIKLVGVALADYSSIPAIEGDSACLCVKSSAYVQHTNFLALESPLICLDCGQTVPLYRISKLFPNAIQDLIYWQSNYKSCDQLQVSCWALEKQAINEMSKWSSDLSKQGMGIAKRITKATGVPTYYYLYRGSAKSLKSELARKCPKCKRKWRLKKKQQQYDFRCDKCLLISTLAWNTG